MLHRLSEQRSAAPVHAIGVVILLAAAGQVLVHDDPLGAELFQVLILVTFSSVPFWVGNRLAVEGASPEEVLRLATLSLVGGLVFGGLALGHVGTLAISGRPAAQWAFMISAGWSLGAGGGALIGYNVRRLERSRAQQADLAKRLTILQRVLRHNLRNELAIIGGATADARAVNEDPEVEEKLDLASGHVQDVLWLSEQSQQLTRIWRTERTVPVDADEQVREEVARFRSEFPDVPLTADLADGTTVRSHPDVGLAVREALRNAAIHDDEVEVSVTVRGPGSDEEYAHVEVRDTGSGIPRTELQPLWGAGERPLEHTTGLGLWLIYWLVESSDGELDVETDASTGTVLTMRLPVA